MATKTNIPKVSVHDFYGCCGIKILYNFGTAPAYNLGSYRSATGNYSTTQAQLDKYNDDNCETSKEFAERLGGQLKALQKEWASKKSYFLAVTNQIEEQNGAGKILLDNGFEVLVPETRNPTGSLITTYIWHLLPKPAADQKSSLKKKA